MKKNCMLFAVIGCLVLLAGCNDEDKETVVDPPSDSVKKISQIKLIEDSSDTTFYSFEYRDDKLAKMTTRSVNFNSETTFEYKSDKIVCMTDGVESYIILKEGRAESEVINVKGYGRSSYSFFYNGAYLSKLEKQYSDPDATGENTTEKQVYSYDAEGGILHSYESYNPITKDTMIFEYNYSAQGKSAYIPLNTNNSNLDLFEFITKPQGIWAGVLGVAGRRFALLPVSTVIRGKNWVNTETMVYYPGKDVYEYIRKDGYLTRIVVRMRNVASEAYLPSQQSAIKMNSENTDEHFDHIRIYEISYE